MKDSKKKELCIHISEIDLDSGKSLTAPKIIRSSSVGLEIAEGSHITKRGKYYYLFTAEGGTEAGHAEYVFRSTKGPMGPWEDGPNNPVIHNSTTENIQNVGHLDIFDDIQGQWWAVHLGVRPIMINGMCRESILGLLPRFSCRTYD
jgi:beta-xylosidase